MTKYNQDAAYRDIIRLSETTVEASTLESSITGVPEFSSSSDIILNPTLDVNVSDSKLINVKDPVNSQDAVTKSHLEQHVATYFAANHNIENLNSTLDTPEVGDIMYYNGTDWVFSKTPPYIIWTLSVSGGQYIFQGSGFSGGTTNPDLYLSRGFTYWFDNSANPSHPFLLKDGSNNLLTSSEGVGGSPTGIVTFTVPMWTDTELSTLTNNGANPLYYVCQFHSSMRGNIYIV